MRDRHRALDVVRDRLARRVRQVVDRQDDRRGCARRRGRSRGGSPRKSFASSMLTTLRLDVVDVRVLPVRIGCTTLPMSTPYLITVSPTAMSFSATLWPSGMSWTQGTVDRPVLVEDEAGQRRAGLDALDDDDRDRIVRVVQYAVNHRHSGCAGHAGANHAVARRHRNRRGVRPPPCAAPRRSEARTTPAPPARSCAMRRAGSVLRERRQMVRRAVALVVARSRRSDRRGRARPASHRARSWRGSTPPR